MLISAVLKRISVDRACGFLIGIMGQLQAKNIFLRIF
jgi:hypothetical protein